MITAQTMNEIGMGHHIGNALTFIVERCRADNDGMPNGIRLVGLENRRYRKRINVGSGIKMLVEEQGCFVEVGIRSGRIAIGSIANLTFPIVAAQKERKRLIVEPAWLREEDLGLGKKLNTKS